MEIYYKEDTKHWMINGAGSRILIAENSSIKVSDNGEKATDKLWIENHFILGAEKNEKVSSAINALAFINAGTSSKTVNMCIAFLKFVNAIKKRKMKFKTKRR